MSSLRFINDDRYGSDAFPSFAKVGWTRPKENAAKHPLWSGRGGCFKLPLNRWLEQPPRLR